MRGYVTRIKGSPRGIEKKGEFAGVDLTISWFFGKYDIPHSKGGVDEWK
mgnify:CR=1 FL=1